MLQNLKQLYGHRLTALDGEIGRIKDFYFDTQNWTIRYVVADTGSWLTGRQVLVSPHAFAGLHPSGKLLSVNLTRKQIEDSPSIDTHKPVSRQYEEEYHRYYGWPGYWQGGGLWGTSGLPITPLPEKPQEAERANTMTAEFERGDANLRSTQAVSGYHLQATDGIIGHVSDFIVDDKSWRIRELVIKIGHRLSGKDVQIPASVIDRVSYEESTVFVTLTKAAVEQSVPESPFSIAAAD
jgi:sporulation protein YlmC with PRC-barrel domain